jgi:small subunit ribosomal protein S7
MAKTLTVNEIPPDPKYGSRLAAKFINRIMIKGKKRLAEQIFYNALDIIKEETGKNPIEVFEEAVKKVAPLIEVRPRKVGGATYQVPIEVETHRKLSLAIRWIIETAKNRPEKKMQEALAGELLDAYNETGNSIKKRDDTHRMAEANKAFAHFAW